jgi:hypothetical protein
MRYLLIGVASILAVTVSPVRAQAPPPGTYQAPLPPAPSPNPVPYYGFNAATPEDAYRDGQINRWQYQQIEGPLPQALQGPSPNGGRGGGTGF